MWMLVFLYLFDWNFKHEYNIVIVSFFHRFEYALLTIVKYESFYEIQYQARHQIVRRLMSSERNSLTEEDMGMVARLADGFSGADMRSLCSEAALGPIRAVPLSQITNIQCDQVSIH